MSKRAREAQEALDPDSTLALLREYARRSLRLSDYCAAQSGCSRETLIQIWREETEALRTAAAPTVPEPSTPDPNREMPQASAVVAAWREDADYVDAMGNSMPLPRQGRRSMASLMHRVDPHLDVDEVTRYLIETGTVERAGRSYRLVRPWICLRETGAPSIQHALRFSSESLRAALNNLRPESEAFGLLQRMAEQVIPVRRFQEVNDEVEKRGMRLLTGLSRLLNSMAAHAHSGEPMMWVGINLQILADPAPTSQSMRLKPAARSNRRD